jgi:hypothetical protein
MLGVVCVQFDACSRDCVKSPGTVESSPRRDDARTEVVETTSCRSRTEVESKFGGAEPDKKYCDHDGATENCMRFFRSFVLMFAV